MTIRHFNYVRSDDGSAVLSGPTKAGPVTVGVFFTDNHLAELAKLLRYAAERLDSGKVSPELKEAEPIVRRAIQWVEIVEGERGSRPTRNPESA